MTDQSGAVVPGAQVTVTSADNGMSRSTVSDSSGHWTVLGLASGNYQVKLESRDFRTSVNNIRYDSSQPSLYQGVLKVGAVAETVEVTAQAVSVETESAEISSSPLNGRNFSRIMPLAPWGVA